MPSNVHYHNLVVSSLIIFNLITFLFHIVIASPEDPFRNLYAVAISSSTRQNLNSAHQLLRRYGPVHLFVDDYFQINQDNLIAISPKQFQKLKAHPHLANIRIVSKDLVTLIRNSPHQRDDYTVSFNNSISRRSSPIPFKSRLETRFYQSYHTWSNYVIKWKEIATKYSSHVRLIVIGQTWEKRPIHAFIIGPDDSKAKSKILLNGMQHAREWISAAVPTFIAEKLAIAATDQDLNTNLTQYMKQVQVIIVPMVNPDGYVYTHTTNRDWRKNRRPKTGCESQSSDGVDLNRNWAIDFGGMSSTSKNPCSNTFTGPNAFSEYETRAMQQLVSQHGPFTAHLDFHSFGQLILGPWSHTDDPPPRVKQVDAVGAALRDSLISSHGIMYQYTRGANKSILYAASGVMSDWMFSKGATSFTIELRPGSADKFMFTLPENQILPTCDEGVMVTKMLLRYVVEPNVVVKEFENDDGPLQRATKPINSSTENDDNEDENKNNIVDKVKPTDIALSSDIDVPFIVGISVGGVVLLGVIVMIMGLVCFRRNRK